MAGYGAKEARIHGQRKPESQVCTQCDDTGFVITATGLKTCPLCEEETCSQSVDGVDSHDRSNSVESTAAGVAASN